MGKYTNIIFELAYDNETENIINSLDNELKDIFEKFKSMFIDMDHHHWDDDSEIYGGITFGQFKRIYMILLSQVKYKQDKYSLNLPIPYQSEQSIWIIEKVRGKWIKKKYPFIRGDISKYGETVFLSEHEAERQCIIKNTILQFQSEKENEVV